MSDMDLLMLYFLLAVSVSFICFMLESVMLSVNMGYVSVLEKEKHMTGALLKSHRIGINKAIASILNLNTIASILGAAIVGTQVGSLCGVGALFCH